MEVVEEEKKQEEKKGIKILPFYFCPKCKRKTNTPNYKMFSKINFGGNLNFNCAFKNYGCDGKIVVVGNPARENFVKEFKRENKMGSDRYQEFLKTNELVECKCGEENCKGWKYQEIKKEKEPKNENEDGG